MAMRLALARAPVRLPVIAMGSAALRRDLRFFSDGTGRVLTEEERAIENVYIQKMERERLEKLRKKAEKEKMDFTKLFFAKLKSGTDKKPQEAR